MTGSPATLGQTTNEPSADDLRVHYLDAPPDVAHLATADADLAAGLTTITTWWEPGNVIVGPAARDGLQGCLRCIVVRRAACRPELVPGVDKFVHEGAFSFDDRHGLVDAVVEELVALQLSTWRPTNDPGVGFFVLRLKDFSVARHQFLPMPLCPTCGSVPDDTPLPATSFDHHIAKTAPDRYRTANLLDAEQRLRELYVDAEAGLVRHIRRSSHSLFPTATAPGGLRVCASQEIGFGRQHSYRAAEVTAVAEALERLGGSEPGGRRTVIRGSYAELPQAVDPRNFGLHDPDQYESRNFPFQPFREDAEIPWVWAHSLPRRKSVLVPECLAYYESLYHETRDRSLVYEISNGCAIGSSLTEAALHGIFETAERDAFLVTWYTRLRPVEVRLDPTRDLRLRLMVEHIESLSGYRVHLFDITNDLRIPSVWVLAVDEDDRSGQPKALCAGGAHLDIRRAFENALLELAPFTAEFPPAYQASRERIRSMLDDPAEVRHMEDHRLLYCAPEAFGRLEFLLDPVAEVSLAEASARHPAGAGTLDLRDDLADIVSRISDLGLDVLVVDQTVPEHTLGGFRCAKVLVPGAIPMTFGHWARRLDGLDRLLTVPVSLGQATRPLSQDDLNPHPHPFP